MSQPNSIKAAPRRRLADRSQFIRPAIYLIGFLPAVWTFYLGVNDQLGADPIRTLERSLGLWALRFLIATLTITPLRDLASINLLRYRRALGLLCFFYALMHLATYMVLDQSLYFSAIWADMLKRPYITIGMLAFTILVPLAVTSNKAMIRRLGGVAWARLHRWVYLAAGAAAAHYVLVVKSWPLEPLVYAAIIGLLLGYRLVKRIVRVQRRPALQRAVMAPPTTATKLLKQLRW